MKRVSACLLEPSTGWHCRVVHFHLATAECLLVRDTKVRTNANHCFHSGRASGLRRESNLEIEGEKLRVESPRVQIALVFLLVVATLSPAFRFINTHVSVNCPKYDTRSRE